MFSNKSIKPNLCSVTDTGTYKNFRLISTSKRTRIEDVPSTLYCRIGAFSHSLSRMDMQKRKFANAKECRPIKAHNSPRKRSPRSG